MKNIRKIVFPNYLTFTCLNDAYFISGFVGSINSIAPAKTIRLKVNLKPWFDDEVMSSIQIWNQDNFKDELLKNRNKPNELWKAFKLLL